MTFNRMLTVGEYDALSPEEKRKWNEQWLEAATGGNPTRKETPCHGYWQNVDDKMRSIIEDEIGL